MAKHAQNLPNNSCNKSRLATVGWKSIRVRCSFLKLIFLWQILTLSFHCVYKKVCVKRSCLLMYSGGGIGGPLYNILNVCKEYGLYESVKEAIECGRYMSKSLWKTIVKESLVKLEKKRWLVCCKLYKSLNIISVENYRMCTWWIHAYYDHSFARQNRVIVRLLLNVYMYLEQVCPCCDSMVVNDVVHILFVCPCNSEVKKLLWDKVEECVPVEMSASMNSMKFEDKTRFFLNAFCSSYIHEWKVMYDALSNYVCDVYNSYMDIKMNLVN